MESWPEESAEKLLDRNKCRQRRALADILNDDAESRNKALAKANQPKLVDAEIVAAILYTGPVCAHPPSRDLSPSTLSRTRQPHYSAELVSGTHRPQMFVKYNGVLRGLRSDSDFLKSSMITLCCPKTIADRYVAGSIDLDEAKRSLNKYTTTLHGINSAIIKLGKLTKATKVYRGISGMALPAEFWEANQFGVRGGVENAFMCARCALRRCRFQCRCQCLCR